MLIINHSRMNTLQKSFGSVLVTIAVVTMVSAFAPNAYAQYDGCDFCGGGSSYSYDPGYDYSYDAGSSYSYDPGYDWAYTPGYDSTYSPGYDSSYSLGYDSTYSPYYSEAPTYYGSDGVMYSAGQGFYPSVSSYPVSIGHPTSYYQTPTPTSRPEPRPINQTLSYSIVPIGQPVSIANEVTSVNENTNTNENVNFNENIVTSTNTNTNTSSSNSNSTSNSSVSNSGNSTNNINVVVNVPQQAPVTPVYQMPIIQYPIQYVYPQQPTYTYQAPYCTLTIANNYGSYNYGSNQAMLTWTSSYATSAYISPSIRNVNTSGSRLVSPGTNQIYTMTVYGQNGQSANCQATYYYTSTYVPPTTTPAPYVSLSQIPYTGFDFGPIGNAMYWVVLLGFAVAAAYLVVYYQGGALALASEMVRSASPKQAEVSGRRTSTTTVPERDIEEAPVAKAAAPIRDLPVDTPAFNLPVAEHRDVTHDSMDFYMSEDGSAPRIMITRN